MSETKPLAEVVVILNNDEEIEGACRTLNELAEDVSAEILTAYIQCSENDLRHKIYMEATQEALLRVFGWKLQRVKFYDSSEDAGKYPDAYFWQELNEPVLPKPLQGMIRTMGLVQPGRSDNGSADNISYEISCC
ncbi:hypothetical protein [Methylovulum miyakonense]|uniref:hypothetical protein n=1 Tax=Methylovulum miyakonense TaxID=645578 RepID=UPI0003642AEB|nr:hypothetical protein [Methylovulum miyakonense]